LGIELKHGNTSEKPGKKKGRKGKDSKRGQKSLIKYGGNNGQVGAIDARKARNNQESAGLIAAVTAIFN
jgi:hypothetical protein